MRPRARGGRARNRIRARSCSRARAGASLLAEEHGWVSDRASRTAGGSVGTRTRKRTTRTRTAGRPGQGRTAPYLPRGPPDLGPYLLQLLLEDSFCFVLGLLSEPFFFFLRANEAETCVKYSFTCLYNTIYNIASFTSSWPLRWMVTHYNCI